MRVEATTYRVVVTTDPYNGSRNGLRPTSARDEYYEVMGGLSLRQALKCLERIADEHYDFWRYGDDYGDGRFMCKTGWYDADREPVRGDYPDYEAGDRSLNHDVYNYVIMTDKEAIEEGRYLTEEEQA